MITEALSFVLRHSAKRFVKIGHGRLMLMKQVNLFASQKKQQQATTPSPPLQAPNKKLTQLQFDDLIQLRSDQAMTVAESKVDQQQKKVELNHTKLKDIAFQMQYLQKHAEQIKLKQLKLVENIEEQQQELKRVKVRAEKEVSDSKKYSVTKLVKELLQAADCINRCKNEAIKEYPDSKDPFISGIVQTQQKLVQILKSFDIEEFDPTGKEFDPNTQESLLQIPTPPGCTPNTVAMAMRTGYFIQGRLLRSARVGIFQ